MCLGQIVHVNVVADAGSIRSGVILAEDAETGPHPERRMQRQGDQMGGFGLFLANRALEIGAGDVEVAQGHVAKGGIGLGEV